jgi:hypothetical protein
MIPPRRVSWSYAPFDAHRILRPLVFPQEILYQAGFVVRGTPAEGQMVAIMCAVQEDDGISNPTNADPRPSLLRWLLYCWGVCLELLGMAFMGAVVVVFFGHVDTRLLLSLTAVAMILFYGGWFCVRQASRGNSTAAQERR